MTYRNPIEAIRQRVELQREDVEARGRRITDELIVQLPTALAKRLRQTQKAAYGKAKSIEEWREVEASVVGYQQVVDEVYQLAPALDERFQQVKRGYCSTQVPNHYMFPDIYAPKVERLRKKLHDQLSSMDRNARFSDQQEEYFNTTERPMLVDARLRFRSLSITLAVHAVLLNNNNQNTYYNDYRGFQARCHVPRGLANMTVLPQGAGDAALQWIGLQKDTITNDKSFDKHFRVAQPADPATTRILSPDITQALLALREFSAISNHLDYPRLRVDQGIAEVSWLERSTYGIGLERAFELLRQLRDRKPPVLLRQPTESSD